MQQFAKHRQDQVEFKAIQFFCFDFSGPCPQRCTCRAILSCDRRANAFTLDVGRGFDANVDKSDSTRCCDCSGAPADDCSGRRSVAALCGANSMKRPRIAFAQRAGSPGLAAIYFSRPAFSRYAAAISWIVLALITAICVAPTSRAQSGPPKAANVILPDVAMLIRGPFGEYSYQLTRTADDSVTLEELGARRMRLEIRQIPDRRCVFVSTRGGKGWGRYRATGFYEIRRDLSALGSLQRASLRCSRESVHLLPSFQFAEAGVLFVAVFKTRL